MRGQKRKRHSVTERDVLRPNTLHLLSETMAPIGLRSQLYSSDQIVTLL